MIDFTRVAAPDILPDLVGAEWVEVNLDGIARAARGRGPETFLDPQRMADFLAGATAMCEADFSLGGYGEHRGQLWRGSYLDGKPWKERHHRGIDVNAPALQPVAVAHTCAVKTVQRDKDYKGGWGGSACFWLEEPLGSDGEIVAFVYGHLDPDLSIEPGQVLQPGDVIGRVGTAPANGNWFEHLHLQALTRKAFDDSKGDVSTFDGYGALMGMAADYPDPRPLLYWSTAAPR